MGARGLFIRWKGGMFYLPDRDCLTVLVEKIEDDYEVVVELWSNHHMAPDARDKIVSGPMSKVAAEIMSEAIFTVLVKHGHCDLDEMCAGLFEKQRLIAARAAVQRADKAIARVDDLRSFLERRDALSRVSGRRLGPNGRFR